MKRIESVPENAVGEISQWITAFRQSSNSIDLNSWRARSFEVLEWAFGSDVFCPPVEVCSIITEQQNLNVFTPTSSPSSPVLSATTSSSSSSISPSPSLINPDDLVEKIKDDVTVTSPESISTLSANTAETTTTKPTEAATQTSILSTISTALDKINWITTIWLVVTPALTLYGLFTCEWYLKTFILAFVCYQLGGIGITAGYHRLFSHRSYDAALLPKVILTILGTSSFEGKI